MLSLLVPGTSCSMSYAVEVDGDYLQRFTELKQRFWGRATASIDDYIRQEVLKLLGELLGTKPAVLLRIQSQSFVEDLKARIDREVNRGLAIIANTPDEVLILADSPCCIVNKEVFEQAIKNMLQQEYGYNRQAARKRAIISRKWVDACAYSIFQATRTAANRRK